VYNLDDIEVFCDAPVAHIHLNESKRAISIELVSGDKLFASQEIAISCRTQVTPKVLMLSSIDIFSELTKYDISQIANSPEVGQNLCNYNIITQYYELKDSSKRFSPPFSGKSKVEYGQGSPYDFALFASIPEVVLNPHVEEDGSCMGELQQKHRLLRSFRRHYLSVAFYYPVLAHPIAFPTFSDNGTHISISAFHMLPLSRGNVSLAHSDSSDGAVCNPRYLSTNPDRFIMRGAVRENLQLV